MRLPPRVQEVVERLDETRGLYYNLARPAAELLYLLVCLTRPREILEIGTANGYAAIILGAAAQEIGARVITVERNGQLVQEARQHIVEAGLQDVVTVAPGSAYKVIKRLCGPFAFVFLDATKQEYVGYLERIRPKLAPQAVLAADNVLSHAEELASFVAMVREDPAFMTTVVPHDVGLLVAVFDACAAAPRKQPSTSIGELVASAAPRIFRGTAADVRNGQIFTPVPPHLASAPENGQTRDGYEESLAAEALRLPSE